MKCTIIPALLMATCPTGHTHKFHVEDCVIVKSSETENWREPPPVYKIREVGKFSYRNDAFYNKAWNSTTLDIKFNMEHYYIKVSCPKENK